MTRALTLLLALLASLPAAADMYQDARNAELPAALYNLGAMGRDGAYAKFPEAQINLGVAAVGNPATFDPLCDGRTTEAEIAAGTAHDCTAAINSAAAIVLNGVTVNVKLQAGLYYITNTVNLLTGQTLTGEGRSKTQVRVRDTFNAAATGVIAVNGNPGDKGAGVRDLAIVFDQPADQASRAAFQLLGACTSTPGGTGCKYPPAIKLLGGRGVYQNVRIERAWDGITGAAVVRLLYIELSALNIGVHVDGPADESMLEGIHFWNFGFSSSTALYTGVFSDGQVDCLRVGRADGFAVSNIFCHRGHIRFTTGPTGKATAAMTNVSLDSDARFIVEAVARLSVVNLGASGTGSAPPDCLFQVHGADQVLVTNFQVVHAQQPMICIYGGIAKIAQTQLIPFYTTPWVIVDGGILHLSQVRLPSGSARTAPAIWLKSGNMSLSDVTSFGASPGNESVAVQLDVDNNDNVLTGISLNGYTISFGCGATTPGWCFGTKPVGYYDLPGNPMSFTVTPTVSGSSDFAPANHATAGQWWLRGNKVEFWLREEFDSNAYTTGANFSLVTTLPPSIDTFTRACTMSRFDKVAGYTAPRPECGLVNNTGGTATAVNFWFPVPGGTTTPLTRTAHILPSVADYLFFINGWYPIR